jgi:regulator of protease activity HflC (stomatin/prohibitin superfamily)
LTPEDNLGFDVVADKTVTEADYLQSPFCKAIAAWGWIAKRFTVSNMTLPESIKKQRERLLIAEKDFEVAGVEEKTERRKKNITITKAQATAEAESILGQGAGEKIKNIMEATGVSNREALQYLILQQKWLAAAASGNYVMLNEGGDDSSQFGAQFGAGFGFSRQRPGPGKSNQSGNQGGQKNNQAGTSSGKPSGNPKP